ncbi:M20 family metallopeptidase [Granulicella cerasi]|uniref:M20 family metallopeptidase n=1 Tax=Granulicella cerasi TaxID=741063 RepID=A0ABW1ZAE2_9BACT|nr:M20 family metallopeptidase [Granulicella cerasi]
MAIAVAAVQAEIEAQAARLKARTRALVEVESPSEDKPAVDRAGTLFLEWAAELGAKVKRHKQRGYGDVLELRFGRAKKGVKPVLLLGHLDTVWSHGTLAKMPWREEEGKWKGPGVVDMKIGVMMALEAVAAVQKLGVTRPITLLLVSEEEIGSPVSRPITEKIALESSAVFVMEPAQGLAYKTARKGVAHFELRVEGVASHAGVDFERGASAVLEMARLIEKVSAFTDLSKGRTVNVGVVHGGTRSNVIAAECVAEVDVRSVTMRDAAAVEKLFARLKPTDKRCKLTVSGGFNRPPMERGKGTVALFRKAQAIAKQMGFALDEAATGGGSDGNFTAALGVPTLDGMGAVGGGAHAAHEHVVAAHVIERTVLLAAMIAAVE